MAIYVPYASEHRKEAVCWALWGLQVGETDYCTFLIPDIYCAEHTDLSALASEIEAGIHIKTQLI